MSKISKALKALWWIARKPVLLNKVLTDEDSWRSYVEKKYKLPGGLPVVDMGQLIDSDSIELGPMTFLDGGSLPTDMMLLAGLAEGIEKCAYFEIGTWRGESVTTVASRALSCHTLCLTDEEMRRMGMHPSTIESHRLFSKELENVTQLRGDSRSFDFGQLVDVDDASGLAKAWLQLATDAPRRTLMSQAALARSVADQLYGYNMTRGYTLTAQKQGFSGTLPVGRVQTTFLATARIGRSTR